MPVRSPSEARQKPDRSPPEVRQKSVRSPSDFDTLTTHPHRHRQATLAWTSSSAPRHPLRYIRPAGPKRGGHHPRTPASVSAGRVSSSPRRGGGKSPAIYLLQNPQVPRWWAPHMPTRHARPTRTQPPLWASARPQAEARLGGRSLDSSEGGRRLAVWRRGSRMRRPPRRDPRPSWYVRVRGGSTRGEPLTSTGSTGAAPPYTCGGPLGRVKPPLPSGQSADHRFGFGRKRLC